MNTQTAAALRALVTEIRERANRPVYDSIAHIACNWCADSIEIVAKQLELAAESSISELADRFLGWPLPESVNPDMCVHTKGDERTRYRLIGTHLLTHSEACAMLEYVLKPDGRGKTPAQCPKHESANNAGVATGSRNDSARESDPGRPSDSTTPNELAAVLTQEGAECCGEMVAHGRWKDDREVEICAASEPQQFGLYKCDVVPAAPRAAEGAGTRFCTAGGVYLIRSALENAECSCDDDRRCDRCAAQILVNSDDFARFLCEPEGAPLYTPTAAAAVPAGGDAVADMPFAVLRVEESGSWSFELQVHQRTLRKGNYKLYTAPAPRGGVTEAMDVIRQEMRDHPDYAWSWQCNVAMAAFDAGASHREANERAADFMRNAFDIDVRATEFWKHLFATPPAAQAQDAGPMARHFVAAIYDIREETQNSPNCYIEIVLSQVEQRARALAAKEAK